MQATRGTIALCQRACALANSLRPAKSGTTRDADKAPNRARRLSIKSLVTVARVSRCVVIHTVLSRSPRVIRRFHLRDALLSPLYTLYRPIYFPGRLNYDVVRKLEAARVLVTTEDIALVSSTGKFMAGVFFFSPAREREKANATLCVPPSRYPRSSVRKAGELSLPLLPRFRCNIVTKSPRINISPGYIVCTSRQVCLGVYDSRYTCETLNGKSRRIQNNKTDPLHSAT